MLDPRTLADRADEIRDSIRKRRVRADLDGAIAAHAAWTAVQTELNEANRQRNEHAKSGKRKLEPEEREAHNAAGKALKEQVGALEDKLREAQQALDATASKLPNFLHPRSAGRR